MPTTMLLVVLLQAIAACTHTTIFSETTAIQVDIDCAMLSKLSVEPRITTPALHLREPQPALTVNSNIDCYSYDPSIASAIWWSNCEPFFSLIGTPVSIANGCQIGICRNDGPKASVTPSTSTTLERQRTTDGAGDLITLQTTTFNCRQGPPRGVTPEVWVKACSTVWVTQLPWTNSRSSIPISNISGSMTASTSLIAASNSSAAGVAAGTTIGILSALGLIGGCLYFARKKWGGKRRKNKDEEDVEEKRELPDGPDSRPSGAAGAKNRTDLRGNDGLDRDHLPSHRPGTLNDDGELDEEDGYGSSEDGV